MNRKVKIAIIIVGIPILLILAVVFFSPVAYYIASYFASKQYKQNLDPAGTLKNPTYFKFKDSFQTKTKDSKIAKFRFVLAYEGEQPDLDKELKDREPQLRSIINLILTSKNSQELKTAGSILDLQEEIQASINYLLTDGKIDIILISESEIK